MKNPNCDSRTSPRIKKIITLILLVSFHWSAALGGPGPYKFTAGQMRSTIYDAAIYRIEFHLQMKMMLVEVTIGNRKGYMLLDTGMDRMVLNEKFFDGWSSGDQINGIHDRSGNLSSRKVDYRLGDFPVQTIRALIAPMDFLEDYLKMDILGICGVQFLRDYHWVIDYKKQFISFYSMDHGEDPLKEPLPILRTVSLGVSRHLLYIEAMVGDHGIRLGLDTGASTTVLDSRYEKLLKEYLIRPRGDKRSNVKGMKGLTTKSLQYKLTKMRVADQEVNTKRVSLCNMKNWNEKGSTALDGIINPISMGHYRIGLNWVKQEMYIYDSHDTLSSEEWMTYVPYNNRKF